jgi:hypothetical protein
MQNLIAFVVMGLIAAVATLLVAISALIKLAPLLIAVGIVVGALRWLRRRRSRPAPLPPGTMPVGSLRPVAPVLLPPRPDGWVLMPMWWHPEHRVHRSTVLDAEIISVDEHRG